MNADHGAKRWEQSRTFALGSLDNVGSMLRGRRLVLGLLFKDMRSALHWAVECWLLRQGGRIAVGWPDQEVDFLRIAPADLQDAYLRLGGDVTRLAQDLFDRLGTDNVDELDGSAVSLAPWTETATEWTRNATLFVSRLVDEQPPRPTSAVRRIEAGALQGRLDEVLPCLLLAQIGGNVNRWRHAGLRAGLFDLGEGRADGAGNMVRKGVLMPLALCRDPELRGKLLAFATLLRSPMSGTPTRRAADRRRMLQDWLDREGLGSLRLADREPVQGWTRFVVNPAVYADVLGRCNYVTAMADERGQTSRVLDHAPFAWTSHGAMLDWGLGDDPSMPVSPFHLYLATDIGGLSDPFDRYRDRRWQFRPVSYWHPFTCPAESAPTSPVSVRLTQGETDYGWIDLDLGLGEGTARITLSDVYDPLPALLDWLKAVEDGDLPLGVTVDEEGSEAWLIAHAFDEDRLLVTVLDRWEQTERASAVVDRMAFLRAVREEFMRFLKSELCMDRWRTLEDDDDGYLSMLLAHPFIG